MSKIPSSLNMPPPYIPNVPNQAGAPSSNQWIQPGDSAENKLHSKLAYITGDLERVQKSGHNDYQNYDYATEADLYDALRGKLSAAHISVLTSMVPGSLERVTHNEMLGFQLVLRYTFTDGETNEHVTIEMPGYAEDKLDKGLYKAITGAAKYALQKNFMISTGDDPEAEVATKPPKQPKAPPIKPPRKRPAPPAAPEPQAASADLEYDPTWTGDMRIPFSKFKGTPYNELDQGFLLWACNKDVPDRWALKERARRAQNIARLDTILGDAALETEEYDPNEDVPF